MEVTALDFLQIDAPALMAAVLACACCGLLGNFLVLRKQSLIGDAIAHAVLPGIVIGFLLAGTRNYLPVMAGALAAAVIAGVLIDLLHRLSRLEYGASMGVVFTVMFALGVVLMEQAAAYNVDLDADCVLYGQLEDILWLAPTGWGSLRDPAVWAALPHEVKVLALVTGVSALFVGLFYKELKVTSFDPAHASAMGIPAGTFHMALMVLVAIAAVAAFEAVGSILVVAMLIAPAATARLLTDRLGMQIVLSLAAAVVAGAGGYLAAAFGPFAVGLDTSLNAAGMIATVCGLLLALAILLAPVHGILGRRRRTRRLATTTAA
jgi:manganese/zinc/iron transport system permease protein